MFCMIFFLRQYDIQCIICITIGFRTDSSLQEMLKEYANKGVKHDLQKIKAGGTRPTALQNLLVRSAADLQR